MKGSAAIPFWPQVMGRKMAAAYLDLSLSTFDAAVKKNDLPQPFLLFGTLKRWKREALDAHIEARAAEDEAAVNEWDAPA